MMNLKIKKNYKVLAKGSIVQTNFVEDGDFEVRLYPPCKRTVMAAGRFYFLPITNNIAKSNKTIVNKAAVLMCGFWYHFIFLRSSALSVAQSKKVISIALVQ